MLKKNLQQNKAFFGRWAKSYDAPLFQFWMRKFQALALKELILSQDTKILDVSCGTGQLLQKLSRKAKLYGVDLSPEMVKIARKKLPPTVQLQAADAHQLPFQDNFFDYTITTEAFHHYYSQKLALREMIRVTKFGGKVIVSDINFFFRFVHWLFQKFEPGCVKINSKKQMNLLFSQVGLKNLRQRRNFLFAVITIGTK